MVLPRRRRGGAGTTLLLAAAIAWFWHSSRQPQVVGTSTDAGPQIFSATQLRAYDGVHNPQIYLAIFGEVFEVSAGARFYRGDAESDYSVFSGRDASASFATGEFDPAKLGTPRDVSSLTLQQVGLVYEEEEIGFYTPAGEPTPLLLEVRARLKDVARAKKEEELEAERYPQCNSRWQSGKGGFFWCDVTRVPRQPYSTCEVDDSTCPMPS
ncbi:uncharacterized protein MONBRDRAFT_22294 [Monosiga brevicollis MX1]|uniref:Uncharacterized protein n=1 Tax=Monosiga brevicollis TaxID=81824 RepID=A9UQ55_MONBE|nr:uncharacterized protein MONBRDRAFT_22294 [Monosiga brevicollis MX1]EDQ92989.1 predicted protein [Monosiga brevicollis MX1]|eukprot:XP_001742751.1 hypothetical protein [Monosiga brevicollis MX1]